jgi:hypothetical protein
MPKLSKRAALRRLLETFPGLRRGVLRRKWVSIARKNFTRIKAEAQPIQ